MGATPLQVLPAATSNRCPKTLSHKDTHAQFAQDANIPAAEPGGAIPDMQTFLPNPPLGEIRIRFFGENVNGNKKRINSNGHLGQHAGTRHALGRGVAWAWAVDGGLRVTSAVRGRMTKLRVNTTQQCQPKVFEQHHTQRISLVHNTCLVNGYPQITQEEPPTIGGVYFPHPVSGRDAILFVFEVWWRRDVRRMLGSKESAQLARGRL
jgi:hypothetical protein